MEAETHFGNDRGEKEAMYFGCVLTLLRTAIRDTENACICGQQESIGREYTEFL